MSGNTTNEVNPIMRDVRNSFTYDTFAPNQELPDHWRWRDWHHDPIQDCLDW